METEIMLALVAMLGLAAGAGMVWLALAAPAREAARLAEAARDEVEQLGMRALALRDADIHELALRLGAQMELSMRLAGDLVVADVAARDARVAAREAQSATALVLEHYGKAIERADALDLELRRERLVSEGLEALFGTAGSIHEERAA